MRLVSELVVETVGLSKQFGQRWALRGLSLGVPRGAVYGLLGPNGAGKSTAIRCLLGLARPSAGQVRLFGQEFPRERLALLRRVGFMVEGPAFYPYLSGARNLKLMGDLAGGTTWPAVHKALERVGLGDRGRDLYRGYSTGMRQRLGIAAAILHGPELVILDEPVNGLDPPAILHVRQLIQDLARREQRTVLVSSHLLHEVELTCDRVAILRQGELVAEGEVAALLRPGAAQVELGTPEPARALERIKALDFVSRAEPEGDHLLLELADDKRAELNRALVEAGVPVTALVPRRHSLEELFFRLTDTGAAAAGKEPVL